jgi:hypothetical protein
MLIDKLNVDKTGLTCNKIGVGYSAFRNQPNSCGASPESCLQNQIEDFHKVTLINLILKSGNNFVSKFGDFLFQNTSNANQFMLSKRITQFQTSVVNLVINADDIQYLVNK